MSRINLVLVHTKEWAKSMTKLGKRVLITGARSYVSLDLARILSAKGVEIHVADTSKWHICSFSNTVTKNHIIPSPRFSHKSFLETIVKITEEEKIDYLIPTCEEILYISSGLSLFPKSCQIFCPPFATLHKLHSKWLFTKVQESYGFPVPKTYLLHSEEDLENLNPHTCYALKACYSRASQNMVKFVPGNQIPTIPYDKTNPWIAQEWLEGDKYCTYSIAHNGKLHAHAVYPVRHTLDGSSCLTFKAVEHPKIMKWVEHFVQKENFTGQIAFDFIEVDSENLFAIECNPRATSGLQLFDSQDLLDEAFFKENQAIVVPRIGREKQIGMGMLLYGWRKVNREKNYRFFKTLINTPDVIFSADDIKPFLSIPFLYPIYWWTSVKLNIPLPAAFTYDLDWNGEIYTEEKSEIPAMEAASKEELVDTMA